MKASSKLLILFLTLMYGWGWAGNTGKIAGFIQDKQTGDPLIGANIAIKGTGLGAASDEDGAFFILQVPPGVYELEASYIGYHTVTVQNVRVRVDLTTRVRIELDSEAIAVPTIVVEAEQSLIQKDITSTRRTTTREEIVTTPGLEQTIDIFRLQGGTIVNAGAQGIPVGEGGLLQVRDESLTDVHVRGGRGGEILYLVDGIPVTHPIYGGRNVLSLNLVDVEQVELLTGAFNAEYGQAQSGVVNITTRTGTSKFTGGLEYKTDEITNNSFDNSYASFYLGGPLGLNIPGRPTFFISGNGRLTNTEYNNNRDRQAFTVLGITVKEKQDNTGNLNGKLTWNLSNTVKTELSYHGSWNRWSRFDWPWRDYPNQMIDYNRTNHNAIFKLNHTLSNKTFYNLNFGYMAVDYDANLDGMRPVDYWLYAIGSPGGGDVRIYSPDEFEQFKRDAANAPDSLVFIEPKVSPPQTDPLTRFNDSRSVETHWRDDVTKTFTFRGDITSQIHPDHLLKTGLDVQYHDIQYVDIQDGGYQLSLYGESVLGDGNEFPKPNGPFPEFGQLRWVFDAFPVVSGFYVQDKFEKETLIINIGARLDWLYLGETVNSEEWKQQWEDATGLSSDWSLNKVKLSPRFGISFPISQSTVTFFSYGHFNQLPELQFFYRDPYTGGFTGNPHLDFEQTVLYEFGFTHQLSRDYAFDVKAYAKDISQQVGTTRLTANLGIPVDLHDNNGFCQGPRSGISNDQTAFQLRLRKTDLYRSMGQRILLLRL